jgi:hypothetical protein
MTRSSGRFSRSRVTCPVTSWSGTMLRLLARANTASADFISRFSALNEYSLRPPTWAVMGESAGAGAGVSTTGPGAEAEAVVPAGGVAGAGVVTAETAAAEAGASPAL